MRRIQTYVEGKTTANKTLAVLKDLGAKQVRYMFEEAFPIPAGRPRRVHQCVGGARFADAVQKCCGDGEQL